LRLKTSPSFAAKPQPFTVLEEINLTLDKGEFVVLLIGLRQIHHLNLVAGFTKPDSGRVRMSGNRCGSRPGAA
jgi:NitT/TauT family transport system ATP-binding protein